MNVHEYVFSSISGSPMPLRNFQGQPILIANTASDPEFIQQYAKLQRIWEDYREAGLLVVGVPCNDFGEQEPEDEADIAEFVHSEFHVTFPMTCKQRLMGLGTHPLFTALREEYGDDAAPRWNFYKYLFNRHGDLIDFWPSRTEPDDPVITHQIERNVQSWIL